MPPCGTRNLSYNVNMKVLFDLLPVVLFFVGFKLYGIFVATAIAIATTFALILYSKIRFGKIDKMLIINGAIISVLGGITLLLHDQTFIMWKPTVLYWLLAVGLLFSRYAFNKNLIQQMMETILNPPAKIWDRLNWLWVGFLLGLGCLNLYVAFHFSLDTWVNFKLFGATTLFFVFVMAQTFALREFLIDSDKANPDKQEEKD
jgi:intracellular septation protein